MLTLGVHCEMIASLARVIHKLPRRVLRHEYRIAVTSAHPNNVPIAEKTRRNKSGRSHASVKAATTPVLAPPRTWIVRVARKPDRPPVRCLMLFDLGENFFGNAAHERIVQRVEFEAAVESRILRLVCRNDDAG